MALLGTLKKSKFSIPQLNGSKIILIFRESLVHKTIHERKTKRYLFNCQDWLSKNEGDGKIERELPAIDPLQLKKVKFRHGVHNLKDQFLLETEGKP